MGISLDEVVLDFATSSVDVSGSEVSLDSTTLAALENITVSATDFDIRDLAFATDSVDVSGSEVSLDATTLAALENISVEIPLYAAMKNSVESVGTTAAEVLATPLANRKEVTIQNEGSQPVYIGSSASVTAANGVKISKNSSATFLIPEAVDIFMIAGSGTQSVRFLELG